MDQEMTLSSYHQAAEALDAQILPLLQRRLDLAGAFARQTPPGRMPIQDRAWERRLLSGVDTDVNSGMFLRLMYRDMMETASAYQRVMADAGEDTLPHECHAFEA